MSRQLWIRGTWGIAVLVAVSAVAIAAGPQQGDLQQQPLQQRQRYQDRTFDRNAGNRDAAAVHDLDHYFTKVLIQANKDEIEMGKLAEERSTNSAVKQLAQQMVQDHTRFMNQLESIKGTGQPRQGRAAFRGQIPGAQNQQPGPQNFQPNFQNPQTAQQPRQQPGGINQPVIAEQPTAANPQEREGPMGEHMMHERGPASQFAKIMEEVDRNMQQAVVRELSSKQGADFDRCYLAGQLFGHLWVAEALRAFDRDASPQLKPILQEGLQTAEQHLTHIKSLLARMEKDNEPRNSGGLQPRGRLIR